MSKILSVRISDSDESMLLRLAEKLELKPSQVVREAIEYFAVAKLGAAILSARAPIFMLAQLPKKPPGFEAEQAARRAFGEGAA